MVLLSALASFSRPRHRCWFPPVRFLMSKQIDWFNLCHSTDSSVEQYKDGKHNISQSLDKAEQVFLKVKKHMTFESFKH